MTIFTGRICPSCRSANSVKALKAVTQIFKYSNIILTTESKVLKVTSNRTGKLNMYAKKDYRSNVKFILVASECNSRTV